MGMIKAAFAFIFNPEARKISIHTFQNGNAMLVREAKMRGLSDEERKD